MSPEERQLLVELFQRTNAASSQSRDRDAEAFIAEAVRLQPFAPYLLAQTVIVQEQALKAAAERLEQLEAQNRELQARAQGAPQPQGQGGFLGGLGGLFGGGQPQSGPPPVPPRQGAPWGAPPQAPGNWGGAPQQQGGPWGGAPQQPAQGGGGFLKGALGAAAGVAGGMLLADSIRGLFHGQGSSGLGIGSGLGQQAGLGGGDTVVNNYYGDQSGDVRHAADSGYDSGDASVSDAGWGGDDSDDDDSTYDA